MAKGSTLGSPLLAFLPVLLFGIFSMEIVKIKLNGNDAYGLYTAFEFSDKMKSDYLTPSKYTYRNSYYDPVRRTNGVKLSDALDQGNCTASSFIAYSIAYDGRRAIKHKRSLASSQYSSPQFMLDCLGNSRNTRRSDIDNCDGHVSPGRLDLAFNDRVGTQGGIARDSNYKWFGHVVSGSQKCSQAGISEKGGNLLEFDILMNSEKDVGLPELRASINEGPTVVHINVYPEFLSYDPKENYGILSKRGKTEAARLKKNYNYKIADEEKWVGYHTLVAVEINDDAVEPYILLLNSFGTTFGDHGYIKIELDLFMEHYLIKSRKVLPYGRKAATAKDMYRLDLFLANVYRKPGVKDEVGRMNIVGKTRHLNYPQKIDNLVQNRVNNHFEVKENSPFTKFSVPQPNRVNPPNFEKEFIEKSEYDPTLLSVAVKAAKIAFKKRYGKQFRIHFDMLLEADQVVVAGRKIHLVLFGHRVEGESDGQRDFSNRNTVGPSDAGIFEVTLWFPPKRYAANEKMDSLSVKGDYEEASSVESSFMGLSKPTSVFQYRVLNHRWHTLDEIDDSSLITFVSAGASAVSTLNNAKPSGWGQFFQFWSIVPIQLVLVVSCGLLYRDLQKPDRRKIFEDQNKSLLSKQVSWDQFFNGKKNNVGKPAKVEASVEDDDEYDQLLETHQRTSRLPK